MENLQNINQEDNIESKENLDELSLIKITDTYAKLTDLKGKKWILDLKNDEWRESIDLSENKEDVLPSKQLKFQNKETAFEYLKVTAFKEEMKRSLEISKEHNLNSEIYEKILEVLQKAESEVEPTKRQELYKEAFRLHEEEA